MDQHQYGSSGKYKTSGHSMKPKEPLASFASSQGPTRNVHLVLCRPSLPSLSFSVQAGQIWNSKGNTCNIQARYPKTAHVRLRTRQWSAYRRTAPSCHPSRRLSGFFSGRTFGKRTWNPSPLGTAKNIFRRAPFSMTIPYPLAQVLGFLFYASAETAVSTERSSGTGQSQSKRNSTSAPTHLAAWHHRRGLCCGNVVQDFNGSVTIPAVSLATSSLLHLGPAPFHLVYGLRPPWFLRSRCVHLLLRGSGCCVHVRGRPDVSNHPWLLWSRGEMAMSLARWFFLLRSRRSWREVLVTGSVPFLFNNSLCRVF